ncbi:MAG: hypothetical protein WBR24_00335 [Desulfobacterales bacterium]
MFNTKIQTVSRCSQPLIREFGGGPIDQVTLELVLTFLNRLICSN